MNHLTIMTISSRVYRRAQAVMKVTIVASDPSIFVSVTSLNKAIAVEMDLQ